MAASTEEVVRSSVGSGSFNTVYSKGTKGSWKTGDEHKDDELRKIFDEMDHDDDGKVTMHNLVLYMQKKESGLVAKFGKQDTSVLLKAFEKMDAAGNGAISKEEFVSQAEAAFHHAASPALKQAAVATTDLEALKPSDKAPVPPAMTRGEFSSERKRASEREKDSERARERGGERERETEGETEGERERWFHSRR